MKWKIAARRPDMSGHKFDLCHLCPAREAHYMLFLADSSLHLHYGYNYHSWPVKCQANFSDNFLSSGKIYFHLFFAYMRAESRFDRPGIYETACDKWKAWRDSAIFSRRAYRASQPFRQRAEFRFRKPGWVILMDGLNSTPRNYLCCY